MFNYKDNQIDKHIELVARDAGRLRDKIHALAVSTLYVWFKGGKKVEAAKVAADRLTRLMNASPYHADAFSKWVAVVAEQVEALNWAEETSTWFIDINQNCKLAKEVFEAGRDTPFFKLKPASKPKPYDMFESLEAWIATATKKVEKGKTGDVVDITMLNGVRQAWNKGKDRAAQAA